MLPWSSPDQAQSQLAAGLVRQEDLLPEAGVEDPAHGVVVADRRHHPGLELFVEQLPGVRPGFRGNLGEAETAALDEVRGQAEQGGPRRFVEVEAARVLSGGAAQAEDPGAAEPGPLFRREPLFDQPVLAVEIGEHRDVGFRPHRVAAASRVLRQRVRPRQAGAAVGRHRNDREAGAGHQAGSEQAAPRLAPRRRDGQPEGRRRQPGCRSPLRLSASPQNRPPRRRGAAPRWRRRGRWQPLRRKGIRPRTGRARQPPPRRRTGTPPFRGPRTNGRFPRRAGRGAPGGRGSSPSRRRPRRR